MITHRNPRCWFCERESATAIIGENEEKVGEFCELHALEYAVRNNLGDSAILYWKEKCEGAGLDPYSIVPNLDSLLHKPCPFCGQRRTSTCALSLNDPERDYIWVECNHCGARGPRIRRHDYFDGFEAEYEAWKAWEKRM